MLVDKNKLLEAMEATPPVQPAVAEDIPVNPEERIPPFPPLTKLGMWADTRLSRQVIDIIASKAERMHDRNAMSSDYDACRDWSALLQGRGLPVEMYKGNGGHYWLAIGGGIFDPKARLVVGFPNLSTKSYDAEKVVWKDNDYVDQDMLSERPVNEDSDSTPS